MAVVPGGPSSRPAAGAQFFCTAGRGLEPFLMREVRERLAATQVEYISGKVFFTTCSDLNMLKQLKSAERLFLLIKKQLPFPVSSVSKGKILNELQRLINDDPESWLNAISIWKNLLELDAKKEKLSHKNANPLKRKVGEDDITAKKLKTEQIQELQETKECQLEKQIEEKILEQGNFITEGEKFQKLQDDVMEAVDTRNQTNITFRVSCRCSGAVAKTLTAQEVGRVIGIALMKQFGWKADLRNPNLEIFIHLSDIYSVLGIPVFRVPLACRAYIKTAGLRSTIAWAMASLAEIKHVYYVGADVSDSQLSGAYDNLRAAGLRDKIELLQVSVIESIMRNAGLEEAQAGIKIAGRNINNLRYADDTTLMAESEEELKSLLMKVKEESEKVGLKLNIQKTKIMASGPITSWEIDGETVETVSDFIFLGSKITADGDCSHEIERRLLLGRKVMTNLDSILKSTDITLPTKVHLVKAMVFPVFMYGCESWTVKKAEHRRIDALNCGVGEDS
ncbi:THUMP domain-containing protein 2 isoform X2 [Bos mutus]|uniref:THUMP domain-containing protein 2 isoform X2 n=1 Tax=Bos mutus TaxID=72004 RepID=UPI0038B51D02